MYFSILGVFYSHYFDRFKYVEFAEETSDEGATTDGWEEEDETEPKVLCIQLLGFQSMFSKLNLSRK